MIFQISLTKIIKIDQKYKKNLIFRESWKYHLYFAPSLFKIIHCTQGIRYEVLHTFFFVVCWFFSRNTRRSLLSPLWSFFLCRIFSSSSISYVVCYASRTQNSTTNIQPQRRTIHSNTVGILFLSKDQFLFY